MDAFKEPLPIGLNSCVGELEPASETTGTGRERSETASRKDDDPFVPPPPPPPGGFKKVPPSGKKSTAVVLPPPARGDVAKPVKSGAAAAQDDDGGDSSVASSSGYVPPAWGVTPPPDGVFSLEVLKTGVILDAVRLDKSHLIFGRLPGNDVVIEHPTSSRFHAVLQYSAGSGSGADDDAPPAGFCVYDLDSTHGTFVNKARIKPRTYVPLRPGHMLKFGLSTRMYIVQGPDDDGEEDEEEEDAVGGSRDASYSELKRRKEEYKREKEERERELAEAEKAALEEDQGISWGMGEDAEEDPSEDVNPFAVDAAGNGGEESFADPKKTLRGWFQREGYELEYDVEEKGYSKFVCRVRLPLEEVAGHAVTAEAEVTGKKKEAVVQCALEACRLLDRYGVLRQATHESRAKKRKNWEEDDFYGSDEDEFLDRTGVIEKKRLLRMKAAGKVVEAGPVDTYDTLMEKRRNLLAEMEKVRKELDAGNEKSSAKPQPAAAKQDDEDLDDYMERLAKASVASSGEKFARKKLKARLVEMEAAEKRLRKLINIAKPASLPPLKLVAAGPGPGAPLQAKLVIGSMRGRSGNTASDKKRQRLPASSFAVPEDGAGPPPPSSECVEEFDDEDEQESAKKKEAPGSSAVGPIVVAAAVPAHDGNRADERMDDAGNRCVVGKTDKVSQNPVPQPKRRPDELPLARNGRGVGESTPSTEPKGESAGEPTAMEEEAGAARTVSLAPPPSVSISEKAKKAKPKPAPRVKAPSSSLKNEACEYDASRDDYDMWVPPQNQSGDGTTNLNKKLGY